MLTRSLLKWGFLGCLVIFGAAIAFRAEPVLSVWLRDLLYFVETGSAATALAICLTLIATA